jgi:hypothetical protein
MYKHALAGLLAAVLAGLAVVANAAPIVTVSALGAADAQTAEQAFLSTLTSGYHTETFETYTSGAASQSGSLVTSVGTFTHDVAGFGGACDSGAFSCAGGTAVLDATQTPFSGRYALPTAVGNDNWLDSMDAQALTFTPLSGVNALGFYLTDANDAGGRLGIGGADFLLADLLGGALSNGSIFYITLFDIAGLGPISLYANDASDGFGIDSVTVGTMPVSQRASTPVPEPGTLTLLGLGLLGIGITRQRKARLPH